MFRFIFSLAMFQQLDPQVYELQKTVQFYRIIIIGSVLLIIILVLVIILQRISLGRARRSVMESSPAPGMNGSRIKLKTGKGRSGGIADPGDLPDPGLIFKYSLANGEVKEKNISIGQTSGSIRTYSTEIKNDHLNIQIRILENSNADDMNNPSGSIYEEYMIDLNRTGKVLINYPGQDSFRQMGPRERIYIMKEDDPAGEPTFRSIDPKEPVRIRLGDKITEDEKFENGYFEFHLFNQEYEVMTDSGSSRTGKNFLVRLYRVYPGYDVSSPDKNGLYPMMVPFGSAGK